MGRPKGFTNNAKLPAHKRQSAAQAPPPPAPSELERQAAAQRLEESRAAKLARLRGKVPS